MKIKGINKLNKTIGKDFKQFGIDKVKCTSDYSYVYVKNMITFKLTEGTYEDDWFKEFVEERFNYEVKIPFIISLLHEVGHHITEDTISDEIYNFCQEEKKRIDFEMENAETIEECKKIEWQYFNLPDEIMATQWAVKYAKQHPKEVRKMWKHAFKALNKFYKRNGIKED